MDHDELRLIDQLRATDRNVELDQQQMVRRVIEARMRRRRRKWGATASILVGALVSASVWYGARTADSGRTTVATDGEGTSTEMSVVLRDDAPVEAHNAQRTRDETIDETDLSQRLQDLLARIEQADAAIAAKLEEQEHQLMAICRVDASANLQLPEEISLD